MGDAPRAGQSGDRALVAGIILGAALATLAPLAGLLVSMFGVSAAFDATATADPSAKARNLAQGISEAMNFGMFGMLASPVGFVIAMVCAIVLWRRRRRVIAS